MSLSIKQHVAQNMITHTTRNHAHGIPNHKTQISSIHSMHLMEAEQSVSK